MYKKIIFITILTLLLCSSLAIAANEQSSTTGTLGANWNSNAGYIYMAQSFTANATYDLDYVYLNGAKKAGQTGTAYVYLYAASGRIPTTYIQDLATINIADLPSDADCSYTTPFTKTETCLINISVASPYELQNTVEYALVYYFVTDVQKGFWAFNNDGTSHFANGEACNKQLVGDAWTCTSTKDYFFYVGEFPETPVVFINDSTESTAVVKQTGSVGFTAAMTTIFSSTFNVTVNNTPIYGGYSLDIQSGAVTNAYCELLIDGVSLANITRTQEAGVLGNAFIQTEVFMATEGEHTQVLQCQRTSGGGVVTVSNAIGIGHFLVNQDLQFLPYNSTTFDEVSVTSGESYTLLDSFDITIGNYTEVDPSQNRSNHIVVESKIQYDNNFGTGELLSAYMEIEGVNCSMYPRYVESGSSGSVSMDCILNNVTTETTYQVNIYGNGSNAAYTSNTIAKNFFLSEGEIIGGTGIITGYVFSGDSFQAVFNSTGGNLNHDFANAFAKLSYSVITDLDTTVSFYIVVSDGETFTTTTWSRDYVAGETGVLIGHDILENLPQDPNYNITLFANCGTVGANCTIAGGSSLGYLTDVITIGTVNNTFLMSAYDSGNDSIINNFNATDLNGTTYTTTTGNITIFSSLSTNTYEVLSTGYFGRLISNHDTNNDLNVTMYLGTINITSPENATYVNEMPDYSFIFENGAWKGLTCSYYDNRTGSYVAYDTVNNVGSLIDTNFNNVPIYPDSGTYSFYVGCESNLYQSEIYTIIYDVTDPIITFYAPLSTNDSFYNANFSLNITITDVNNYDALVNITDPLGALIFNQTYNTSGINIYNITDLIVLSTPGKHTLFIEAADGHTKKEISVFKKNNIPDGVKFNKEISIYGKNGDYVVTTEKKLDRYSMKFINEDESLVETLLEEIMGKNHEKKVHPDPDIFIVEVEDGEIDVIEDSQYKGHLIIRVGDNRNDWYWLDFENEQDAEVTVTKSKKNQVEVGVYGNGNYQFNSIGRLNVVNQTVEFYYDTSDISLVATYESDVVSGFDTVYNLAATLNPLTYDLNETKTVTIDIDGDLYTGLSNGSAGNTFYYYYPFTIPGNYDSTSLTHQWFFETLDRTNATVQTTTGPLLQNVFTIMLGNCNTSLAYTLINFSYYDEKTGASITANMNYDLSFFDGTYYYPAEGFFNSSTSNSICTNLDPDNVTYSWSASGLVTLDEITENYTTRVFTFAPAAPLLSSNADPLNQSLYLIKLSDSQTVEYTWLSTSYALLDGVMRIYRCNSDNTRSMVESPLITGGRSTANIQLLTASYAYDVVVNGRVYTDESYNICHIQASQDLTYYVALTPEQLTPVSGLLFTQCTLTGPDNDSVVTMTWDDNSYDDTPLEACIQGLRSTLGNNQLIFEECSTTDTGTLQVVIPDNSNAYTVRGFLTQGNNSAFCNEVISVNSDRDAGSILDMTGLYMIILLVLGIALYYSDNADMSLFGTALALIIAWVIGLTAFGWLTTSSIVMFILIVLYISRGARRR